jgi:plastocyanin
VRTLSRCVIAVCVLAATVICFSQGLPGTSQDRVGYPEGFRENFQILYVMDRPDTKRVLVTYANDLAMSVQRGQQGNYPYGSVIAQEQYSIKQDDQGNPMLDENGRFIRDALATNLNVMRKEVGFGTEYAAIRTGEWEYVSYRPDKTLATLPQNSGTCANCHTQAGGGKDWVFRASLHFNTASGAVPDGVVKNYKYVPGTVTINAGQKFTIYNDDVINHNIVLDDGSMDSQLMKAGTSVILKLDKAGEYPFHCSIHPNMKGKLVVQEQKK